MSTCVAGNTDGWISLAADRKPEINTPVLAWKSVNRTGFQLKVLYLADDNEWYAPGYVFSECPFNGVDFWKYEEGPSRS